MIEDNDKMKEAWAIDADPKNDPSYPMKKTTGDDHRRLDYPRPVSQPQTTEVLHSNERPGLTAVFGTSSPPSGLSGMIRRFAFRYSEGSWGHWLPLILADRVNVIEGIAQDLAKGIVPNIFKERGWNAEWKYNRPALITKVAVRVAIVSAIAAYIVYSRKRRRLLSS
jgi:hypothetical protein